MLSTGASLGLVLGIIISRMIGLTPAARELKGLISDIGLTSIEIPIRTTAPDRVWLQQQPKKALYMDGDDVHDLDNFWYQEVDDSLRHRGWIVLRERYHGSGLDGKRLIEVLAAITDLEADVIREALR